MLKFLNGFFILSITGVLIKTGRGQGLPYLSHTCIEKIVAIDFSGIYAQFYRDWITYQFQIALGRGKREIWAK